MGITFNDLMLGIISVSLKKYFVSKDDHSKEITVALPYSFNSIPEDMSKYKFGNSFASLTLYMPLEDEIGAACKAVKKKMDFMKKSLIPSGVYTLIWMYNIFFPYFWTNYVSRGSGSKHSLLISNIPGYVKPVTYCGGGKVKKCFFLGSGSGNLATSIGIVSICKRALITINSDETQMDDVNNFMNFVNEQIDQLKIRYDPNEEGED
jgi:hypothetical protein